MPFWDTVIVAVIVFLAAAYLYRSLILKKGGGCGCGNDCAGCSSGNDTNCNCEGKPVTILDKRE